MQVMPIEEDFGTSAGSNDIYILRCHVRPAQKRIFDPRSSHREPGFEVWFRSVQDFNPLPLKLSGIDRVAIAVVRPKCNSKSRIPKDVQIGPDCPRPGIPIKLRHVMINKKYMRHISGSIACNVHMLGIGGMLLQRL